MGSMTRALRRAVFARDAYRCQACGLQGREERSRPGGFLYPTTKVGVFLSADHIVPSAHGGMSILANLRTLCMPCNRAKSDGGAWVDDAE